MKYKDDGRDLVTVADFVALHVTFPFINAWVTYQIVYVASIALCAMCPDQGMPNSPNDWYFCQRYVTPDAARFYYILCVEPSKAAFLLIFIEMSIYITYYKDVMFSLLTLVNFVGMLIVSQEQLAQESVFADQASSSSYVAKTHQISNWLIVMVVLNVIWLVVTVITDFDSAFYRKAFVYKRRVDKALLKQR